MLADARVEATVPTESLDRAREFYEGPLGLRPAGAHAPGVDVLYRCGGDTRLLVYERASTTPPPAHTLAHFVVQDVEATVRELRAEGVTFQDYDLPELTTIDGVATTPEGLKLAWFTDPDGNILAIHD